MKKVVRREPKLRFPEFQGGWNSHKTNELFDRIKNGVEVRQDEFYQEIGIRSHGKGVFHKTPVSGKSLGTKRVFWIKKNVFILNIVFAWEQAVAKTTENETGLIASHRFPMFEPKKNLADLDYFLGFFLTKKGKHLLGLASPGGAGRNKTLGQKVFDELNVVHPSLPEQQKIASFLSAVDQKIGQLTRKKELLEQYKKGVMQKIFSHEFRFQDENGQNYPDWKKVSMNEIFQRISRKNLENNTNVLTISAQHGLINQKEFFNKSVAAADVTGYFLLKNGDFAYNKSYSKGYPMGAIKRLNKYDKGVVSTLYICFAVKDNDIPEFYEELLEHGGINKELHKIAQEGARNHGLLNMSVVEFFEDVTLPRPCVAEQEIIAEFLSKLTSRIENISRQLDKTLTFKKGLLQRMFV